MDIRFSVPMLALAVLISPAALSAQALDRNSEAAEESRSREEAGESLPEELIEQAGPREEPRRDKHGAKAPQDQSDDGIEIDPVPNRREVYRRLMEQLQERRAARQPRDVAEHEDVPPPGFRGLLERFGIQGPPETDFRERMRESVQRKRDAAGQEDLRVEFLRLMEARANRMSEDELREAVAEARLSLRLQSVIAELEDIVRQHPDSAAAAKASRAIDVLRGRPDEQRPGYPYYYYGMERQPRPGAGARRASDR